MEKKLKSWQGWLLFGGSMVVVFVLGLCVSALMERRAEVASIFNNRKNVIKGIEARNELFKDDFPREYQTWTETAKTDFESEFNGNIAVDALEKRPEMVILWAGYAFSKDYSTPRGHMHAIEDITASLRTGAPVNPTDGPQPSTCWTCKSPDVPRMMEALGVDSFYNNKWGAMGAEIVRNKRKVRRRKILRNVYRSVACLLILLTVGGGIMLLKRDKREMETANRIAGSLFPG